MTQKVNRAEYKTKEAFKYDVMLIINNCRTYNDRSTTYYQAADQLEIVFTDQFKRID